ncbi:MAG: MBOAT family protein [Myxococcales bacterium]|nr:MBOAT family protein [Myxococcales bacterium]
MLFASFDFLLFLPPVLAGYWMLGGHPRARLLLLLAASYFFYCAGAKPAGGELPPAWYFLGLLVASTLTDYYAALGIAKARARGGSGRAWLWLSVISNLGILGYFKYTGFAFEIAGAVAGALGASWTAPTLELVLPIGLSFYTFQSLSYTVDVWRGRIEPERSLTRFAAFVACFPQLVAGPIVRASELLPQLRQRVRLTRADVDFALYRISKGLLKKVVLGDFIAARFTDVVFSAPADHTSLENLLALYAFTLQIYADFSGYSDIAVGVARLLGLQLPENFDRPYQAANVAEFWRRWHMTLSTWIRDYVFFPLGGSRGSLTRTCVNLWLTLFLIGMWHGASYNFVIYSNLQAFAMVFHRLASRGSHTPAAMVTKNLGVALAVFALGSLLAWLLDLGPGAWPFVGLVAAASLVAGLLGDSQFSWARPVNVLLTFHFVVLSRIFFRAEGLDVARQMAAKLVALDGLGVRPGLFRLHDLYQLVEGSALTGSARGLALSIADSGLLLLMIFGLAVHFLPARPLEKLGLRFFERTPAWGVACVLALLGATFPRLLAGPRPNIYFAF